MAFTTLAKRLDCDYPDNPYCMGDTTSYVIRYAIVIAIVAAILIYVFVGMWHANRRVRSGKAPLFYHRWLVPSRTMNRFRAEHNQQGGGYYPYNGAGAGNAYQMPDYYQPPPPTYGADPPPVYMAPEGPPPSHEKGAGANVHVNPVGQSSTAPAYGNTPPDGAPQAPAPTHPPPQRP